MVRLEPLCATGALAVVPLSGPALQRPVKHHAASAEAEGIPGHNMDPLGSRQRVGRLFNLALLAGLAISAVV